MALAWNHAANQLGLCNLSAQGITFGLSTEIFEAKLYI